MSALFLIVVTHKLNPIPALAKNVTTVILIKRKICFPPSYFDFIIYAQYDRVKNIWYYINYVMKGAKAASG